MITEELLKEISKLKSANSMVDITNIGSNLDHNERMYLEVERIIRQDRYQDWDLIKDNFTDPFFRDFSSCYYYLFNNPVTALELTQKLLSNYELPEPIKVRVLFWEMDAYFLSGEISAGIEKMAKIPSPQKSHPIWRAEAHCILGLNYYFINKLELSIKSHLDSHLEMRKNNDNFLEIFNASMAIRVALKKCDPVTFDFFSDILSSKVSETNEKRYLLRINSYKALLYDQLGDKITSQKYWDLADQYVPHVSMKWEIGQYYLIKSLSMVVRGEESSSFIYNDLATQMFLASGSPKIYLVESFLVSVLRPWLNEKFILRGLKKNLLDTENARVQIEEKLSDESFGPVSKLLLEGLTYIENILEGDRENNVYNSLIISVLNNVNNSKELQTGLKVRKNIFQFIAKISELKSFNSKDILLIYEESFETTSIMDNGLIVATEHSRREEHIEQYYVISFINNLLKILKEKNVSEEIRALCHDIKAHLLNLDKSLDSKCVSENISFRNALDICDFHLKPRSKNDFQIDALTIYVRNNFEGFCKPISPSYDFLVSSIPINDIQRVLHNLIKNSKEAGSSEVTFEIIPRESTFILRLIDDGPGIPIDILKNLNKGGISKKVNGHGIGLSSSLAKVISYGGKTNVENLDSGCKIELEIPYLPIGSLPLVVVLDDDKYQKFSWMGRIPHERLKFYSSHLEMLNQIENFPRDTFFYVDKNMPGIDGVEILKKLRTKDYRYLFLNSLEEVDLTEQSLILCNLMKNYL